ncbi:MAG: preprotein translocase subunit SecE [Leptolyngbyaceae cyanobacterium SM2_3_12]|nr:preprotein translocase subunit SecE [Leptolyngbyaceae cyanobacterium SM2_3_12]
MVKKETATESKRKGTDVRDADEGFNLGTFLQGTKEELSKVVWPGRQQLISESAAVILMVSLSATLVYLVDQLFGWASRQVF